MDYGDDSGEFARDGERDDRRFTGPAMAPGPSWENAGRDATGRRQGVESGLLSPWDLATALSATRCDPIDFGDDGSDDARDDPGARGAGAAVAVGEFNTRADASDCRRLCEFGVIGLRGSRSS